MSTHKPKRSGAEHVDPDLPITPMLDMSFQLLAFFVVIFKPAPTEGQLALALPSEKQDDALLNLGRVQAVPDKPRYYIVRATATETGTLEKLTLVEEGSPAPPRDLGANVTAFRDELKTLSADLAREQKTGRLTLELDDKLRQAFVVQLMDTGIRAGFRDISPVPVERAKR
jgi:biopolymer transport protein ExbD